MTRYLIVGGGMTADAAAHAIRERDPDGAIVMVSAEPDPPYNRPPLTKGLWKGDAFDTIWRPPAPGNVDVHLGRRIVSLRLAAHEAVDQTGAVHAFDKLLLATGAAPRRLPFGGDDIIYYRTVADYRRLRTVADGHGSAIVIGGGFIGSEIAAALTMNGCRVTMIFPEAGIGARLFPADLAAHLLAYYRDKGVTVLAGAHVRNIQRTGASVTVTLDDGTQHAADVVVAGIGVAPDTQLAEAAGIATDDGILIDAQLRTSAPDVFAAGDVARFHSPQLGTLMRVEHEDNALTMGTAAGHAMTGDATAYTHLPFFYSDLFELGYEAVGELDPRLDVVADWKTPFREGVIYYLQRDRVRGVLLWGIFGKVDDARALIANPASTSAAGLRGRIVT